MIISKSRLRSRRTAATRALRIGSPKASLSTAALAAADPAALASATASARARRRRRTAAEFPSPGPSESGRGSGRMRGSHRTVTLPATAKTSRLYGSRPLPPPAAPRLPGPPPNQGPDRKTDSVGATRWHPRRARLDDGRPPRPARIRCPRPARGPRHAAAWQPAARKTPSRAETAPLILRLSRTVQRCSREAEREPPDRGRAGTRRGSAAALFAQRRNTNTETNCRFSHAQQNNEKIYLLLRGELRAQEKRRPRPQ